MGAFSTQWMKQMRGLLSLQRYLFHDDDDDDFDDEDDNDDPNSNNFDNESCLKRGTSLKI